MSRIFTKFANAVSAAAGSPFAFIICAACVVVWACTGPLFGFSDTWQLMINTSTTVVTFLMVFLIQNTQNRDNGALHAKLDELIRATMAISASSISATRSCTRSSGKSSGTQSACMMSAGVDTRQRNAAQLPRARRQMARWTRAAIPFSFDV